MFLSDACPIFSGFFEAPTTAMLFGLKNVSSGIFIPSSSFSFLVFQTFTFVYLNILKYIRYTSEYLFIYIYS
jgi:hypothetical protein